MTHKAVILCILDGWGYSKIRQNNAILTAHTPFLDYASKHYPYAFLETSGAAVGLPTGQMGNSESGHMTIGAGRVIQQDLVRIDQAIASHSLSSNAYLKSMIATLKQTGGACHLLGMISDGGVHSHIDHIIAIANELKKHNIPVMLHAITDGRDVAPRSADKFLKILESNNIYIATIGGRYYAMDRDNRWDRTQAYYEALVHTQGQKFQHASDRIHHSYAQDLGDEFIIPAIHMDYKGMQPQDGLIIANFRADRVRQILHALLDRSFTSFNRIAIPPLSMALGMVSYAAELDRFMSSIFPPKPITHCLGSVIAEQKWKQLRLAETEKYAHVTYFFNGGQDVQYPLEERIIVPSTQASSYDLAPEMSALEITSALMEAIQTKNYRFICVNFANADMVGHTGNFEATVKACEVIDQCLSTLYPALKQYGAEMLITADHGNAESMFDVHANQPLTAHTTNKVPLFYIGDKSMILRDGGLSDIAPTILHILNITPPYEMTGKNLLFVR